jgi:hypothetical protein
MELAHISNIPPIEIARFPSELSGEKGSNRADVGRVKIEAQNDVDAIKTWLARFVNTSSSYSNYRKEAERLLLWSIIECKKPISSLTHDDLQTYQRFLADPQPREQWLAKPGRKWPRFDPEWRPFVGPLSATSQRQSITILNTLFSWLVKIGYLASNPLK